MTVKLKDIVDALEMTDDTSEVFLIVSVLTTIL